MIVCQNCGKEIAEDSAHCGHCGAAVKVSDKKTMMGFGGAIDSDALKKELEKAKEKSKVRAADEGASEGGEETSEPEDERSMAPTEMMDADAVPKAAQEDEQEPEGDADASMNEFATAKTAAMEQLDAEVGDGPEDSDVSTSSEGTEPVEGSGTGEQDEEEDRWEIDPDSEVETPEVEAAAARDEAAKPQGVSQGSDASSGGGGRDLMSMGADDRDPYGAEVEPEDGDSDGNRRLLLIVGAVLALMILCCVLSTVGFFISGGLEFMDSFQ